MRNFKKHITKQFEEIIDIIIQEEILNDQPIDPDDYPDYLDQAEYRQEAFELLMSWLMDDQGYLHSYNEIDLEMDQLKTERK